jgi:hypothetical protein
MSVDWIVSVEEDGFGITWGEKMRHKYLHRIPWARFDRVQVMGPVTATRDERTSYRRYAISEVDLHFVAANMAPGIYQICYSPEGTASTQTFLGETNLAYGTGRNSQKSGVIFIGKILGC